MGSFSRERGRASAKSCRCARLEGWRDVYTNERGLFAGDDLAAYQFWIVKACQLYAPALGSVPENHSLYPLCVAIRHCYRLQSKHAVSHIVSTIRLFGDFGICHNH